MALLQVNPALAHRRWWVITLRRTDGKEKPGSAILVIALLLAQLLMPTLGNP